MARRKLNVRFLLILMGCALVLGIGIHLLNRVQVRRNVRRLLEQAAQAEAAGQPEKAARFLERYLGYEPGDVGARSRYASLVSSEAMTTTPAAIGWAAGALEAAIVRDPLRDDLRRRLAELLVRTHEYEGARTHLKVLLGDPGGDDRGDPRVKDGHLEYLRALCHEGLNQDETAMLWYERAKEDAPGEIDAYVRLAGLLRRVGRNDPADRVMDAKGVEDGLIAHNGKSFRAYLERAMYRKAAGLPGLSDDIDRALALAPDDADVLVAAAEAAEAPGRGDLQAARKFLAKGVELHPRDWRMYLALAGLESRAKRPEEARGWLERGLDALPGHSDLQLALVDHLTDQGKLEQADQVVTQMREGGVAPVVLVYLEARLLVARGRWVEAAHFIERSAPSLLGTATQGTIPEFVKRVYLLLGECYERMGDTDRRYAAYRSAEEVAVPGSRLELANRLGLAAALAAQDRIEESIEEYRKALRLPGAPVSARMILARLLAVRTIRLPEAQRQWSEVDRALDDVDRAIPGNPEAVLLRAEILAARGQIDDALKRVRADRDRDPDRAETWIALAGLEQQRGDSKRALELLEEARRRLGDRPQLRLARVLYWGGLEGPKAAEALAAIEREAGQLKAEDRRRLDQALADAYLRVGDLKRARPFWERLASESPYNLRLQLTAFEFALQEGDRAGAEQFLGRLKDSELDGSLWRYARANMLIWEAERADAQTSDAARRTLLDEARQLLDQVAQRRPTWSSVPRQLGRIDDLRKDPAEALTHFTAALELGDRHPETIRRAARLLTERGRFAEAEQVLRRLQDQATSSEMHRLAADLSLKSNDYDRALEQARKAVAARAKDYREHLWLGKMLWAVSLRESSAGRGDRAEKLRAEAEASLRRAVELDGKAPDAWVALIRYLVAAGRRSQAVEAVDRAKAKLVEPSARLALADCFEAIGAIDQAQGLHRNELASKPNEAPALRASASFHLRQGLVPDAERDLRKMIELKARAPEDAAWAQRTLALLMAAGGDHRRASQALAVLGGGAGAGVSPSGKEGLADRRAMAGVLALQKSRSKRREAIRILGEIVREGAPEINDRILLAQLLEADGDWPGAREHWRRVLLAVGESPAHRARYIRSLLRHGELDEAQTWLAKLEASRPRDPVTIELKARTLAARGRGAEAAAVVTAFLGKEVALAPPFAILLEQLGQYDEAERLSRRAAQAPSGGPKALLQLAAFLGRRGRVTEALDLLDSPALRDIPIEAATNARIVVLYGIKAGDEAQYRRVEAQIARAIKAHPEKVSLLFDLANLRVLQGRYEDAEAIFQQIHAEEKANAAPLNNLAWLLALRGRGEEAQTLIQQAIELGGEIPDLLDTRALVSIAMGKAEPAIRDLEDAIVLNASPENYFHLAQAYRLAGKSQEANEALGKAKEMGLAAESLHPLERQVFLQIHGTQARR